MGGGYKLSFPKGKVHIVQWREEDVILILAVALPPARGRMSSRSQAPTSSVSSDAYAAEFFMSEDVRESILDALGNAGDEE